MNAKTNLKVWPINFLLIAWSVVAFASALSHFFLPVWTADGTVWTTSAGWQREVAYFNVLLVCTFVSIARSRDVQLKLAAVLAITTLSVVLGSHHLQGWLTEPRIFHIMFTTGNFIAALWGLGCLIRARLVT